MINIKSKTDCCGCMACGDICPKNAITFTTDKEGFWYPNVNLDSCIDCGLCENSCPILHSDFSNQKNSISPTTYILQLPAANDRLASASGGAYTLLARTVFSQGGFVAGHIWGEEYKVCGYISSKPEDLEILRGTKYLQSNIEGLYKAVRDILKTDKLVLFSGCPCQVAALKRFLRRDYNNLITTDFTCMGIDSPFAFIKYIESLESEYSSKIIYFKAKAKEVGWRHLTNKAVFTNGQTYFGINGVDANLQATFLNLLVRPSCYDCKFKGFPRISDITIGDYWRKKYDYDPLDDNTGTSYIILNNKKAEDFFEQCKENCIHRKIHYTEVLGANPLSVKSLSLPSINREEFYERIHKEDFKSVVNDYVNQQNKSRKAAYKNAFKQFIRIAIFYRKNIKSFFIFLYYNFISKRIKTNFLNGDIILPLNIKIDCKKESFIQVNGMNIIGSRTENSCISLGIGSTLILNNNILGGKLNLLLQQKIKLSIGAFTELKNNIQIKLKHDAKIGDFTLISDNVIIDDTNSDVIFFNEKTEHNVSIKIGTHVLLGRGVIIKPRTHIGDEVIIKDYSIVEGVFKPRIVLEGNPARVSEEYINWKYNFNESWNYKK